MPVYTRRLGSEQCALDRTHVTRIDAVRRALELNG